MESSSLEEELCKLQEVIDSVNRDIGANISIDRVLGLNNEELTQEEVYRR